jgi:outer membrane protein TolC
VPGILITRLRFDEQRAEFERRVHLMLRNVETAYWNLYNAYWTLYSREQGMRSAFDTWRVSKARFEAGKIAIQDYAQARQQYESFRGQRLTQLGNGTANDGVLERERILRTLLGLPVEDGVRLVPVDTPTLTPYRPDWDTALNETLALRPELFIARQDVKFQQLNLINVKNLLLPDLRFTSTYALNGIGNSLDGTTGQQNTPTQKVNVNAFRSLASDRFVDWTLGVRLNYVLGYRDAHAQLRTARLNLARSYAVLREQESKAQHALAVDYRLLIQVYESIQIRRSQREAAAMQLQARFKEWQAGKGTQSQGGGDVLFLLLDAQRTYADALRTEFDAITQYNNAIVAYEFSKGTIMQFDNVVISEGPLPHCAQVRAVEHERERSRAIILRERANPLVAACDSENCGIPRLPEHEAPSVPKLFEGQPPLPEITEPLPDPQLPNPKGAKSESSSKAGPLQKPPADGVPGAIIWSDPPQPLAPAAPNRSWSETPRRLPAALPEGSSGSLKQQ